MKIIQVLLPLPNIPLLHYSCSEDVKIGDLVILPFRKKHLPGIVWQTTSDEKYDGAVKAIEQKLDFHISHQLIEFIQRTKNYYLSDLGSIAKMVLPVDISHKYQGQMQEIQSEFSLSALSIAQQESLQQIQETSLPVMLQGVTGSGKTEIYFHLIAQTINSGKQALLILPEIALSQQITQRFKQQFNFASALWHSSVSNVAKQKTFKGIISGSVKVVIGARSSLFLPYKDLGLIIVDEEHDSSYKQESNIYYNARDMAVMRAHIFGFKVVLGSATPSIETYHNAVIGKYKSVVLKTRYQEAQMPQISIVDMKKQVLEKQHYVSAAMQAKISQYLASDQQVLLFLNRKGYAPLMICTSCGFKICCLHCSSSLVWHKSRNRLECHYCGFFIKLFIKCPGCKTPDSFTPCGPGIERLHEEVSTLYPSKRIMLISKEEMSSLKNINIVLEKILAQEVDIIIGTQIITKGYHFPKLNFVGVIDADIGLSSCDLKSCESTFQLLQQVSGRAGRQDCGEVMLQTYQETTSVIDCLIRHDYDGFIEYELKNRLSAHLPPYSKLAIIMITAANQVKASDLAKQVKNLAPHAQGIKIMGPAPAMLSKLKGRYRYNILVINQRKMPLQNYLSNWIGKIKLPSYATLKVDIDPYSLV